MPRPRGPETVLVWVPVDKLPDLEKILGRKLAVNQTPVVKIRILKSQKELIK